MPAMAQSLTPVKVLLDWAWLPYHTTFLVAQEKGYYKEAGLDVQLEQGRGSATTALMLSQGGFDIAHLNVTNAAQMISKGGAIKAVGHLPAQDRRRLHRHQGQGQARRPAVAEGHQDRQHAGRLGRLEPQASSPPPTSMKLSDLNVVALDANAKTAALFGGTIDAVSGDSPAFNAYVRATNQEPVDDAAQRLRRAADRLRLRRQQRLPREESLRWSASSSPPPSSGFVEAARDYKAACELMQAKVHLAGTIERCIDYNQGLLALSTPPTDAELGPAVERGMDQAARHAQGSRASCSATKPLGAYYTNDFVPK